MAAALCCVLLLGLLATSGALIYTQPQQVHIVYGEDPTREMYVVWSTVNATQDSSVRYFPQTSPSQLRTATGISSLYKDPGPLGRVQYIHRVKVTGLTPGQKYYYTCGSGSEGWSDMFSFSAMKEGSDWSPRLAVYGDLGNVNPASLPRLQLETEQGMYDAVLHVGDIAYDMYTDNGEVGDEFMRQIEPIAAYIPYLTCPGNHEMAFNFSHYKSRFIMPGDVLGDNMFFSFNMGPAHIISFSSEHYFSFYYGRKLPIHQYQWLEKDLQEATQPANRAQRPWIITMAHRPMYCSNNDQDDCTKHQSVLRTGVPAFGFPGLEPLFYKYGVDLSLWAHEHSYERLWPLYDYKMYNGSTAEPYTNPGAPVHIITGSAGCQEKHDYFKNNTAPWSAFRSDDYGYTRMTINNATHLYMEQVSVEQDGKIIDSFWLKKDHHGAYPPRA
ncbi:acid phosphatase type 7-like [Babylonia areolata]|uniref:acid phosphatase type 7-like n=1 Tax=Babylonia areolata TaxID=304850 RepID=UPI003FD404A5